MIVVGEGGHRPSSSAPIALRTGRSQGKLIDATEDGRPGLSDHRQRSRGLIGDQPETIVVRFEGKERMVTLIAKGRLFRSRGRAGRKGTSGKPFKAVRD